VTGPTRPAGALVRRLGGRWTLPVLGQLAEADCRYQELLDALKGVSHKVLTETVRRAERDGLITRHLDADRVESAMIYRLTPLGRTLEDPLALEAGGLSGGCGPAQISYGEPSRVSIRTRRCVGGHGWNSRPGPVPEPIHGSQALQ
jgi:DNA-binding HxlR family transcriptional regulator